MKYAVIGAGWAGCSAAVELAASGHEVHLFEAARTLGGRARQVNVHGLMLDNGQHILLGAYKTTLKLFHTLGICPKKKFLRSPLQLCYPQGMQFVAGPLPAPLHMLFGLFLAKGLTSNDKMVLARFFSTARWMDWQLDTDCTVAELLKRFDQTECLIRCLWQPLCTAALNTPIQRASAQIFLNVLKDSLNSRRAASDMLVPLTDLTTLLPQPAADFIKKNGGQIHLGKNVQTLIKHGQQWQLDFYSSNQHIHTHFDGVVIATPPDVARNLLTPLNLADHIPPFNYEPITTCYLQYPPALKLPRIFLALQEQPECDAWGQFVFDRGQLNSHTAGLFAVVISAAQSALEVEQHMLATSCAKQLAHALQRPELAQPQWSQVITEKRATFSCTPGLLRPTNQLSITGLVLAGDYTDSRYPATLESAVQSGLLAANCLQC